MKERVVTVTPGKRLTPDPEVRVGVELGSPVLLYVMVVFLLLLPAVVRCHQTQGNGPEERDVAPRIGKANGMVFLFL